MLGCAYALYTTLCHILGFVFMFALLVCLLDFRRHCGWSSVEKRIAFSVCTKQFFFFNSIYQNYYEINLLDSGEKSYKIPECDQRFTENKTKKKIKDEISDALENNCVDEWCKYRNISQENINQTSLKLCNHKKVAPRRHMHSVKSFFRWNKIL